MLVLTRKKDQALFVGESIEITVLDIQGDQVRIGIKAPKDVKIFRKELFQEIQAENRSAASPAPGRIAASGLKISAGSSDRRITLARQKAAGSDKGGEPGSQPKPESLEESDGQEKHDGQEKSGSQPEPGGQPKPESPEKSDGRQEKKSDGQEKYGSQPEPGGQPQDGEAAK